MAKYGNGSFLMMTQPVVGVVYTYTAFNQKLQGNHFEQRSIQRFYKTIWTVHKKASDVNHHDVEQYFYYAFNWQQNAW